MKENLFKLLATIILALIVLSVIFLNFSNLNATKRGNEVLEESEKLGRAMGVAHAICPGKRMSDILYERVDSAGDSGSSISERDLSGWFTCNVDNGECIVLGLYRREVCADGGFACSGGMYDNVGVFEFTVENSNGDYIVDFRPDCSLSENTAGCCIRPTLDQRELPCDWWRYELTYYGPMGSLNIKLGNGEKIGVWSKFMDKWEKSSTNTHTCSYDGKTLDFGDKKYYYRDGELDVVYVKCCSEGYEWVDGNCVPTGEVTCVYPAFYAFGVCWVKSNPGESCESACKKTGKICSSDALQKAFSNGMGEDCEIHEDAGYTCFSCNSASLTNNVFAPYMDGSDNCYYFNKSIGVPFICSLSNPLMYRICPCKVNEGSGKCGHVYHEVGTCVDEDMGKYYAAKACTVNDTVTWQDTCIDKATGAAVDKGRWLEELYCDGNKVKYEIHDCGGDDKCEYGKCI